MSTTKDLAEVLRREIRRDPRLAEAVEREALAANIAGQIYDARIQTGLTQKQLAAKVGTQQSVIARMEDSDYKGHSLSMLHKIASAVGKRVFIEFRTRFTDEFLGTHKQSGELLSKISWDKMLVSWNPQFSFEGRVSSQKSFDYAAQGV